MKNVLTLSVSEILTQYKAKTLSPIEVMEVILEQIEKFNPALNAFVVLAEEKDLLEQARASEKRWKKGEPKGLLDGIPVTIKDGADVIGWPTREGSATLPDIAAKEDAPLVKKLREAGAIFLGKTTTPEFGHKGVTDSPSFGITRNPWNAEKTSGGSSGGAAVAAATGMGLLHHGTDGGGSIRIPASFCGVFGFKPTQGLMPSASPSLFSTIASSGPIACNVEDAALMLDVMTEKNFSKTLSDSLKNRRIAYIPTLNNVFVQSEVSSFVSEAVKKLSSIARVKEVSLEIPNLVDTFNKHWMVLASWLLNNIPKDMHTNTDPCFLSWGKRGSEISLDMYLDAELERLKIIDQIETFFEDYDLLVMPTMALTAFDAGINMPKDVNGHDWEDWTPFTFLSNLAKLPAASLPCGVTKEGLPVGIQIISAASKDALVLNASYLLEKELSFQSFLENDFTENKGVNIYAERK